MLNQLPIKQKLMGLCLGLLLVPLVIVGLLSFRNARAALEEKIGEGQAAIARAAIEQIDRFLQERYNDTQAWAALEVMQDVRTDDVDGRITDVLGQLKKRYGAYDDIYVLNPSGEVVAGSDPDTIGKDLSSAPWFSETLAGREVVKDVGETILSKEMSMVFTAPIRAIQSASSGRAATVIGVVAVALDWEKIFEITNNLRVGNQAEGNGSFLILLNKDGVLISAPDWMRGTDQILRQRHTALRAYGAVSVAEGGYLTERALDGEYLIGYAQSRGYGSYQGMGWSAYAFQDAGQAFQSVGAIQRQILFIGAFLFISFGFVGFLVARGIVQPMNELTNATLRIAKIITKMEGDLTQEAPVRSKDELGQLASSFNTMISGFRGLMTRIRDAGLQVSSQVTEINQGTNQQAAGAAEQSSTVTEVSTTVEELAQTSGQIAENSESLSMAAEETLQGIQEIKNRVDQVTKKILALGEKSHGIGNITKVIDDLADRTNLLALNAAIEAARAGEAGHGFAVVAAEVGKLAERSAESTKDIRQLITEIQSEVNSTIIGVEDTTRWTEKGLQMVGETVQVTKEISIATQQQKSAAEQVVEAMSNIDKVTTSFAATARQTASSTEDLSRLATQLKEATSGFKLDSGGDEPNRVLPKRR